MQALIYRGNDFELHTARRLLTRLGAHVDCEPRVFDLIVYLIERRDRAVDKQELIDTLWNGRPVSDASLSQLVYKARKALADHGDERACIQTVHGRGFRWVAAITTSASVDPIAVTTTGPGATAVPAIEEVDPSSPRPADGGAVPQDAAAELPTQSHSRAVVVRPAYRRPLPWIFVALAVAALTGFWRTAPQPGAAAVPLRVLVLPVDVDTGSSDLDWARLGIMGLITTALETEGGLATVEPATAHRLGSGVGAASPAQRRAWRETTGARYSLSLHLSRAGPLLKLDAVLDSADGERRRSLFGEEAGRLALDMSGVVRDWLDPRPRADEPPRDLDGEVASTYALGVDAQLRGDFDAARKYFMLCMERSPDSLQPRLQLAMVELQLADVRRAADLIDEALARVDAQRQPHFALDAQWLLGYLELQRGRLDAARAAFESARRQLHAESTPAQRAAVFNGLAHVASRSGRYAEAATALQETLASYDSVGDAVGQAVAWNNIGVLERMRGRTAVAETALLRSLAIERARDIPWQESLTVANLVQLRVSQRHYREALQLGETALLQLQSPSPRNPLTERVLVHELAVARLYLGQTDLARRYATRLLALAEDSSDPASKAMARVILAEADVALGQPGALARYRAAIDDCEATGQMPRAAYHTARLAVLQRRAGDLAGLRESVAGTRRLAGKAATTDLLTYAAMAQAQLDAAEMRQAKALQGLLDIRRDALRGEDRINAQQAGLDYIVLAIEVGRAEAAGALLAELGADNDTEGDGMALAETWHRARGDNVGADVLRARREQLDAALPPPNAEVFRADG